MRICTKIIIINLLLLPLFLVPPATRNKANKHRDLDYNVKYILYTDGSTLPLVVKCFLIGDLTWTVYTRVPIGYNPIEKL